MNTTEKHVVSFSGGKDSTAMLLMMIERSMRIDRVICVDTTKEFPQMYKHIRKVQKMIAPLKIEVVKIDYDYWFGEHILTKGNRKGTRGYGWPGIGYRWCTSLKVAAIEKVLRGTQNVVQYLGIAADEAHREGKNQRNRTLRYPLIEWDVIEAQALRYCYDRGLDWGGLYNRLARVSCYCCPLARVGELETLYNDFPELWKIIKAMDQKSNRDFRPDQTVKDLENRFERNNRQLNLFEVVE